MNKRLDLLIIIGALFMVQVADIMAIKALMLLLAVAGGIAFIWDMTKNI